ncbi:MAG TPA: hypothetical protein VD966_02130 [Pyrinomonadaceae bacterium]|nr:hypothetical protein [Pyrinomonadaceae bacterium]
MSYIFRTLKNIFFWSYARHTWQYDVLCVLILAFIFLTPQSWFANSELRNKSAHQSQVSSLRLSAGQENLSIQPDRGEIERRVRAITGRPGAEVLEIRTQLDAQGKIIAYEVDIR